MRIKWMLTAAVLSLLLALSSAGMAQESGMAHYLLVGMDGWGANVEGGARSDAIVLASLDFDGGRIVFTSFARDSIVKPDYRNSPVKLNTLVRSSEGEHMLMEYLQQSLDIPISGYFAINFSGTVELIETIGGVNVELTADEAVYLRHEAGEDEEHILHEGLCRLNGGQAIYYMRCRSLDNDYGRQRRQGKVLCALMEELKDITPVQALLLLDDVMGMYRTSLTLTQQVQLAQRAVSLRGAQLEMHSLPEEGVYRYAVDSHGTSGIAFDVEANRARLHEWLGIDAQQAE